MNTIFFLVSPDRCPSQHLHIMVQIAHLVDGDDFARKWTAASSEKELKEVLLRGVRPSADVGRDSFL